MPRARAQVVPCPLDCAKLSPNLFIGAAPPFGDCVRKWGFDVLVLCAKEYQPATRVYPGVDVLHVGLDDSGPPPTPVELVSAGQAAKVVADQLGAGRKVLVTCMQGRNRSGLVSALALCLHMGMSGRRAITYVQNRRRGALTNEHFCRVLERVRGW